MRIATFNLENLDDRPGAEPALSDRVSALRPLLDRLAADVLSLQEVNAQPTAARKHAPRTFRVLDELLAGSIYEGHHRIESRRWDGAGPMDVQNLVVLSRYPIEASHQIWNDLVPPPDHMFLTADEEGAQPPPHRWERPVQHVELSLPAGRVLHLFNLHFRAPLAAFIPGRKEGAFAWKTAASWAEGFYLAGLKRSGQALETRLAVDAVFDKEPDALVAVCGDMNATVDEVPLRILRAAIDDTGNAALAPRSLTPLERTLPDADRHTVIHAGRALMLDHILASRALVSAFRSVEILNEALEDELVGHAAAHASPDSFHAPVVAEFVV